MSYAQFAQWYALSGYVLLGVGGLIGPLFWLHGPPAQPYRRVFAVVAIGVVALSVVIPISVLIPNEKADTVGQELLMRSGRIVDVYTAVVFGSAFVNRMALFPKLRYFFWLTYGMAVFVVISSILLDVLISTNYQFVRVVGPFLAQFGIQDLNFTSPISYLIKFIFLSLLFRDLLASPRWKWVFQMALWVLVVFELMQMAVFKSYLVYDSLSSTVKNVFIIGATSIFLYQFYQATSVRISLQRNPYFWIMLGLLLPALAEIFLEFIFQKLYQTDTVGFYKWYLVRNASQMVGLMLMSVGIWYAKNLKYLPASY